MRLKHIHIKKYKNLKNFDLEFKGDSFIDVFVGKNATGKSNLFEAIIEIFHHLYKFGSREIGFDYSIIYEIDGNTIEISWIDGELSINKKNRKSVGQTPLPDNVLIYYSGHNSKITDLVQEYEDAFKSKIKEADIQDSREFIGVGKEYKQLLLAALLLQKDGNRAKQYIFEKLGFDIANLGNFLIRFVLKRPDYAINKEKFDIILNDDSDRFWQPQGITKKFLTRLYRCLADDSAGPVRKEGYFQEEDEYILYVDVTAIQKEFEDFNSQELFQQFDNLKILGMLHDISMVNFENGREKRISDFSDGQFQSVYIYSIIELFQNRNCITLLDEPDSFLHPEWQHIFLEQLLEITNEATRKNHVLMTSHSPVTLIKHVNEKIKYFDIKKDSASCYDLPKNIVIKKLSTDIIRYSEPEQLLSILNRIQIENKPVFFTEGHTDPIILKEAWQRLYDDEIPFIPFYAFSCSQLYGLLKDDKIISEMNSKPLFGMFDFDQAYNQWKGIKGEVIDANPFNGLIRKREGKDVYAIMLPVPQNETIKNQVIKTGTVAETYCHESLCEIEHLFYGSDKTKDYFREEHSKGGGTLVVFKSDSNKTAFAENIVPTVGNEYFETFRPLFEFVKSKC